VRAALVIDVFKFTPPACSQPVADPGILRLSASQLRSSGSIQKPPIQNHERQPTPHPARRAKENSPAIHRWVCAPPCQSPVRDERITAHFNHHSFAPQDPKSQSPNPRTCPSPSQSESVRPLSATNPPIQRQVAPRRTRLQLEIQNYPTPYRHRVQRPLPPGRPQTNRTARPSSDRIENPARILPRPGRPPRGDHCAARLKIEQARRSQRCVKEVKPWKERCVSGLRNGRSKK